MSEISTACCIAGGGPAGMMLGYLLARAGVEVVVLEKHADFLRDFRGDTVHPSTLDVMDELGLYDAFLARPHHEIERLFADVGDETIHVADFRHLPGRAKFLAITPQWEFLNFLAEQAGKYKEFHLFIRSEAVDLLYEGDRVMGVVAKTPDGDLVVRSALVVGADGRHSVVRQRAGLEVEELGAPMDVLWLSLPRRHEDETAPLGRLVAGRMLVMIPRGDYFQCGVVVKKGAADEIRAQGLDALKRSIAAIAPIFSGRMDALKSWDDVKLLTVAVDRLKTWSAPGLLCIGDAAHAMSPIGGVGINLAVQDAVAAAALLWAPLSQGRLAPSDLAAVQKRREWPAKVTQSVQIFIQRNVIAPILAGAEPRPGWPARLLDRNALLQRLPARALGLGARTEHVRSPDRHAA